MMNNGSDGKMDDEEDPNLPETEENKSVHKNRRLTLSLYSSVHSTAEDSDMEQAPLSVSRTTQRRGTLEGVNEVGERSEDEYVNSSKPDTNIDEPEPRARFQNNNTNRALSHGQDLSSRSMRQSRSSMRVSQASRLFDSNEVMQLMGVDDESTK